MHYVEYITAGIKELKKLLRVIMGYIFSSYNNAKLAFLLYGIPHTGKSVLASLLSKIVGEQYVTNVDLSMLHRQEYAASLSNALLNVAPDLKNTELKDVGFFKSLVSHDDTIMARSLYSNPTKIRCEAKMLFSSNHLISFSPDVGIYDIEAVFNRLLYFPFQNTPIKDEEKPDFSVREIMSNEHHKVFDGYSVVLAENRSDISFVLPMCAFYSIQLWKKDALVFPATPNYAFILLPNDAVHHMQNNDIRKILLLDTESFVRTFNLTAFRQQKQYNYHDYLGYGWVVSNNRQTLEYLVEDIKKNSSGFK
jgi:hypothetical protein